jgi:hypothetical protein
MRKVLALIVALVALAAGLFCPRLVEAQASADVYNSIKAKPSTIRWCLPEAGEDEQALSADDARFTEIASPIPI